MRRDSSSDVAASDSEGEDPSVTAVADEPAVTRERAPEVQPGDVLAGRYQVEAIIGKGGSGIVLRAFDRVSATVVAVKVLKPGLTHDPRWEKRFQRELRLGRPIRHPNVCRIFDIGDADGYRFLTMEYATGGTLRDLVKKNAPLRPLQERLADAAGVIAGLAAIHGAGIVHRDVKPDNVLRTEDGRLVLSDFGLATDLPDSTMVSVFVGTPHYMAPEVREGDPATTRSDVWSLGVVLHEIFFGKRPEKRSARSVSGVSKTSAASTSSTVERAMLALCMRCLADDPAERPEDARAVERLLASARSSPGVLFRRPWRSRRGVASIVLAIASVAVVFALVNHRRHHGSMAQQKYPSVSPSGEAIEWSKVAANVTTVSGPVHCFSMVDNNTARLIWGTPRRADDVRIDSGRRWSADIATETYMVGCPALSPDGRMLLFTTQAAEGGAEIRVAENPTGKGAKSITVGADPVWLRAGEEFLYNIDSSHAAIFSLPTRRFRLLGDPGLEGQQTILRNAASPKSDIVALLLFGEDAKYAIAIYEGAHLDRIATFFVPSGQEIRFGVADEMLVTHQQPGVPVALFDWRKGIYRNAGRYDGLHLVDVAAQAAQLLVIGRHRSNDVWRYDDSGKSRLTNDGEILSAAMSPDGDLLTSKIGPDGNMNIWWKGPKGDSKRVTSGQFDTLPDFSPDGRAWAFIDYTTKSIMICASATQSCRPLRRDEMLPAWPKFSPDGKKLAYVTQVGVPKLMIVDRSNGTAWQVGDAHWQCAPVWSSSRTVWGFEGSPGHYFWTERDIETQTRTGGRLDVKKNVADPSAMECWPSDEEVGIGSPFFRRVRIETEEESRLLRIPRKLPD
jgi:serine/threonine-protein kinase